MTQRRWWMVLSGDMALPDWLISDEDANDIGPDGILELVKEDPLAFWDFIESALRFEERTPNGGSTS